MKHVFRTVVVALVATSGAFISGEAGATEPAAAADLRPQTVHKCDANEQQCIFTRSNMGRHYKVGPMHHEPGPAPDATCATYCPPEYYWFEYWPK